MVAGRQIRFTAVLVAVVFALTGFSSHGGSSSSGSSSGKSKSKSSGSGSGGGCSSSKSKRKSHSGSNGSTASASASASASPTGDPATVVVVTCAGPQQATTTVRFTSRLDRKANVRVNLSRERADGTVLESSVVRVTLEARETRTVDVALEGPSHAADVKNCRLATPETDTATGSPTPADGTGTSKSTPKATPKPAKSTAKR
ncbi:hypothetical protein [Streptomyces sp. ISL-94]|uniref:hypothetical protein n=1 Tax=Streptomyces sp. ISL-94 TaxID=2819190 RepID=UPI001BEA6A09|nr:hypothetical protein [Streptomyces sp. ISL-94]MBT2482747.1 hypothetical protein [Streptomyces sp. ISL-94]